MNRRDLILNYYRKVKQASKEFTKKEIFKDLLNRLYLHSPEIISEIDKMSLGSEKTILNIKLKNRDKTGYADTYYNKVIIEFENNLAKSIEHAKEQLIEYLVGSYNSGEDYNFTLIASDFLEWRIFSPVLDSIEHFESISVKNVKLEEIPNTRFMLNEKCIDDFYYFLDRFLFREEKQKATLEVIQQDFGEYSQTFIEVVKLLSKTYNDAKKYGDVKVAYDQWEKFLSVAYGKFESNEKKFIIHTYLSIFSKLLAYVILTEDEFIDDNEIHDIITGEIFNQLNVKNFIEHDFYYWVGSDRYFRSLKKAFRKIAQQISQYNFSKVDEDILKGVYQELIDLDTRHALGEYYTPDWLCESIVNQYQYKGSDRILDPACGSGSFLRAVIARQKELFPNENIETLNNRIFGIDIHPLSVQIAKTTVLLAYGEKVRNLKKPISLNIFLANSLIPPTDSVTLFGKKFDMVIDKNSYSLSTEILHNNFLFNEALSVCEELSEISSHKKKEKLQTLKNILEKRTDIKNISRDTLESFYFIYIGFKEAKEKNHNGIWKFIVQNSYKPYFLKESFDYIIGNPPWFTFKSIKNKEYADLLRKLAEEYNVMPEKTANFPHMEIAAIFLAHSSSFFLKHKGKIAFVLPRSFMSADHHDNTRDGRAKGFKVARIWDLDKVQPLFRVPCCVLFARKTDEDTKPEIKGIPGNILQGKFKKHNSKLDEIKNNLLIKECQHYYSRLGKSTAYTSFFLNSKDTFCYYKKKFKQGATIVPRSFYFIELNQESPKDFNNRILNIRTNRASKKEAKKPWDVVDLEGRIESKFFYRTALAKNILPFTLYNSELVVLPIILDEYKKIQLFQWEQLKNKGYLDAANWFRNVETLWNTLKTEKNKNVTYIQYLNWLHKLENQDLNIPYLVIYNASAKDANAALVLRENADLSFIVDVKSFWLGTNDIREAYYILSLLNCSFSNILIKPFQSRGLFGARDVHKKILDLPFPKFKSTDKKHLELSKLGKECVTKATKYASYTLPYELSYFALGKARLDIKVNLSKEITEIDKYAKELIF